MHSRSVVVLRLVADRVEDRPECLVCQVVAFYLDVMLGRNRSTEAIEKALETVCDVLPESYAKQVGSPLFFHWWY